METVQPTKETTAMDLGALLDACDDARVTLVAGDTRLVAHRAVLVDRSPVFAAMFGHDTLEARGSQVTIADVEGPVLRQLLSYLYTLRVPQLPGMAPQLLVASDKYGVSGLKAACEQQVAAQLSVETAAAAAVLAVRHSCNSLRKAAVTYIKDHTHQVMATQGWANAVHEQPGEVVEVSRLLADPPPETSTQAPADSETSASARPASQPHSDDSRHSRTPASAAPPKAVSRNTAPPDEATVSRLRRLNGLEKERRLIRAAKEGAVGELEALLAAGADVVATEGGEDTRTALHWAARRGHVEVVRLLLTRGAEVDATDSLDKWTPLHWAAVWGHAEIARLLLDASADHRARDCKGNTPLLWAVRNGHIEAATALLEAGAEREARNVYGQTPLNVAKRNNNQQLRDLLSGR